MCSVNQGARSSRTTDSSHGKSHRVPSSCRYVDRVLKGALHCGHVACSRCAAQRKMHFTAAPTPHSVTCPQPTQTHIGQYAVCCAG